MPTKKKSKRNPNSCGIGLRIVTPVQRKGKDILIECVGCGETEWVRESWIRKGKV